MALRVLLVDDDEAVRFSIQRFLEVQGFVVRHADGCAHAKLQIQSWMPDVMILDHQLPDGHGTELLVELQTLAPGLPVVLLTGHGSIELAVQAVKSGAHHFMTKPVSLVDLHPALVSAIESHPQSVAPNSRPSTARVRVPTSRVRNGRAIDPFLGDSEVIRRLREVAYRLRQVDRPILVLGETGTGKSLLARWFHESGPRRGQPFVDLNCAGIAKDLLESELFGHDKGAFTGAHSAKVGLFEAAHLGTLFLDEIGDMDLSLQPKLLTALEEGRFRRIGEVRDRSVDVRLVTATHQDLSRAVQERRFRGDLFYRISALPLVVPPLRERMEDLAALSSVILEHLCDEAMRPRVELSSGARQLLEQHSWPGNLRELRNVLDRALCLCGGSTLERADIDLDPLGTATETTQLTLQQVEVQVIARALRDAGGKVEVAAKKLGIPRSSMYQKLKVLGLRPSRV